MLHFCPSNQNSFLITLVQEQQKKIEDLLLQSKTLMKVMAKENQHRGSQPKPKDKLKGARDLFYKHCKIMIKHKSKNCFSHEANKDKCPQWYIDKMENNEKQMGQSKE